MTRWNPQQHPFVAMPIGGIGTGSVAVGSDGGLRQFQLHNVGHHRGDLPGTFLALRTQQTEPTVSRTVILQAPRSDPGALGNPATPMVDDDLVPAWQRDLVAQVGGTETTLSGPYPTAEVRHRTGGPVNAVVRATSPFQPSDADASGVPAILVEVDLHNHSEVTARTWLAFSAHNAVGLDPHLNPRGVRAAGYGGNTNTLRRPVGSSGEARLVMENPSVDPASPWAGSMVLACVADEVAALPCFTEPLELVDHLSLLAPWGDHSRLAVGSQTQTPQVSAPTPRFGPSPAGQTWLGALTAVTELAPGETRTVRFCLAWHFPNRMVDFIQFGPDRPELGATRFWLGNHYASRWADASAVADDALANWDTHLAGGQAWASMLGALDLPETWTEHLATQPIPLRTPTTFRTFDGATYGFEGVLGASTVMWSGDVGGSCPLNCTHVWNYAQAGAALFPELEASMRATEFDVMLSPEGVLPHRVFMPPYLRQLWDEPIGGPEEPALDGMCGAVLKTYRELLRGAVELSWVESRWERLGGLMDHIARTWDPDDTGLLQGVQPTTHDIGLHGANPFTGTYWLAALRAAEELARLLGDDARAERWRVRFERSSAALDAECFRDGYYVQVPEPGRSLVHQWGAGCLSDQLIGQWWAHQLGLGHLLPEDHVREALRNVVAHNLRSDHDEITTTQRAYAVRGETGLVMCSWPTGGRPEVPTLYCDEVWTGSEYQVAAHCLYEGLRDEADAILGAMWARHDGTRRNPFNEVECGDHYARAMAGWSVLEAALGLRWNSVTGVFSTAVDGVSPLFTGSGWGEVRIDGPRASVRCRHGMLRLHRLTQSRSGARWKGCDVVAGDAWVELEGGGA